jgi:dihydrolipoamide dehydrogenase
MTKRVDVLVIGGGPAGYPAAIRASQLGNEVILVERKYIGGECLHWGCIPSAALGNATNQYHNIKEEVQKMGIIVNKPELDIQKLQEWRRGIQQRLVKGIRYLLRENGVETIMGRARFLAHGKVEINKEDEEKEEGTEIVEADNVIIAIGAQFQPPEDMEFDNELILEPTAAINFEDIPQHILLLGENNVTLELANIYSKLGSKVTLISTSVDVHGADPQLLDIVHRSLKKKGVEIIRASKITGIRKNEGVEVEIESGGTTIQVNGNRMVVTVVKRPNLEDVGLDETGIDTDDRGFIVTDDEKRTSVANHYAIGDCTGPPFMAHRGTKHGLIVAEGISGNRTEADFRSMPCVIFTDPEIAFAGLSEMEAKERGYDVITGKASFAASGRALTLHETEGFVKVVLEEDTGVILGIHIVGPRASDLISEVSLALEMGAVAEDVSFTVHPHPTLPEMIMEAVASAQGKAIHIMNPRR